MDWVGLLAGLSKMAKPPAAPVAKPWEDAALDPNAPRINVDKLREGLAAAPPPAAVAPGPEDPLVQATRIQRMKEEFARLFGVDR